jgi:hypothetical protein
MFYKRRCDLVVLLLSVLTVLPNKKAAAKGSYN